MNTEHISISEAARRVGVSRITMTKWVDSGKVIAFMTPSGTKRVFEEEIDKIFNNTLANAQKEEEAKECK